MTSDDGSKFQHVFEYFTERTPRSHFELRETSLVWNYKYAGSSERLRVPSFPLIFCVVFFILLYL